ncbi:MAG TPA: LLM class flavin-dependent oxidoreductase [Methylomirabilota bacterium]|nr:LLM class flavin-dependent oxidoreductase [Methylomirabilota bacterium]
MTKLGLAVPFFHALPVAEYVALAREAETRGYDTAWTAEVSGPDAFTTMTLIASHTTRLRVATGVVPVQTRTPIVLGLTAATLGHLAPGRIALGLGVSSPIVVSQWHGLPFRKPLAQLREAVQVIRMVLTGERVTFDGEFYKVKNFRLTSPPPPQPVAIYLGALGPKMLELAGEIADGVLLNWLAPDTVRRSLPHVEKGARGAGRSLANFEIAAFIRTCVTDAPEAARQWLARDITGYAIVDAYAAFFRASGYAEEVEAVHRAWKAGDRAGAVKQISPRVVDGLGVIGPPEFCRERISGYAKAGLTMPVVFPFSPDADPRPSLLRTVRTFP